MDPELYNAAINGSYKSFSKKIKLGVNLNLQLTSRENSLLHVAAKSGKKKIAEVILDNSQREFMYEKNSEGNTALHIAASLGHLEMTQLLIDRTKPQGVEVHNELPEVEVHIELQEIEVQNELQGVEAQNELQGVEGQNELQEEGQNELQRVEAQNELQGVEGQNELQGVEAQNELQGEGQNELQKVEAQNELQRVEAQNERQGVEAQNELLRMVNLDEDTPVHVAVKNGHYKIVEILIREEPRLVLSTNSAGESPLFLAVDRGFYEIALHILKKVPECSYEGRNKMNVLHAVAIRTRNYFVRELVNNRPSALLEKDDFGWIPLHHAAHAGNAKVVELFLEINHQLACIITDKEGMSALHISAKKGHVDVMRTLITKCPEICELLDIRGRTALHVAVESGKSRAVKLLLETQAFQDLINKQDKEGNTPLHLAAVKGSFFVFLRMALNRKVDKGATNSKDMTAMDIVSSQIYMGSEDTSLVLKKMGFLPSLQQGVTREANRIVMKGQSQETERKDEAVMDMAETTDHQENAKEKDYERMKDMAETTNHQENEKQKDYERIKDMASIYLLIATIIATVTFAAGIALPGGFNTNINDLQTLTRKSATLRDYVVLNSLAFGCSSATIFLHFALPLIRQSVFAVFGILDYFEGFILILTELAIIFMMFAFLAGTNVVFPQDSLFGLLLYNSTFFTFLSPFFVPAVVALIIFKKVFKK